MLRSAVSPKTIRSFRATPARMVWADCSGDWAPWGGPPTPFQIAVATVPGVAEVTMDILVPQFIAQGEGQPVQRGLGGGIHRLIGHRVESDAGNDVHDRPAALGAHDRQHRADAIQGSVKIQGKRLLPVGVCLLIELPAEAGPGVVEQLRMMDRKSIRLHRQG